MKTRSISEHGNRHVRRLQLLRNLFFVLLMLLGAFGSAAAADTPPPPAERTAVDPYDQWSGDFLDFAPPNPDTLQMAQPDGTTLQANLTPMETGGQLETPDGYTIVRDDQGWWTYAASDTDGKVVPSSLKVGKDVPYGIAKKLGQTESIWVDDKGNDKRDAVFAAVKDAQSPNASIFTANDAVVKNYHYVVVLAEFTDVKFEPYQTPQYFKDQISGLGTSPTGTVSDLYYEMSYGQFLPDFEVIGPFHLARRHVCL